MVLIRSLCAHGPVFAASVQSSGPQCLVALRSAHKRLRKAICCLAWSPFRFRQVGRSEAAACVWLLSAPRCFGGSGRRSLPDGAFPAALSPCTQLPPVGHVGSLFTAVSRATNLLCFSSVPPGLAALRSQHTRTSVTSRSCSHLMHCLAAPKQHSWVIALSLEGIALAEHAAQDAHLNVTAQSMSHSEEWKTLMT